MVMLFLIACSVDSWPDRGLPLIDEVPIVEPAFAPCRDEDDYEVVQCVLDGDTFDIDACGASGERVRMLGINAPEIAHGPDPADCFGDESADEVAKLLAFQEVTLTFDQVCEGRYGRTLAYVWARDELYEELASDRDFSEYVTTYGTEQEPAILLNEAFLGVGLARQYPEEIAGTLFYQDRFDRAAEQAEAAGVGLYEECGG